MWVLVRWDEGLGTCYFQRSNIYGPNQSRDIFCNGNHQRWWLSFEAFWGWLGIIGDSLSDFLLFRIVMPLTQLTKKG